MLIRPVDHRLKLPLMNLPIDVSLICYMMYVWSGVVLGRSLAKGFKMAISHEVRRALVCAALSHHMGDSLRANLARAAAYALASASSASSADARMRAAECDAAGDMAEGHEWRLLAEYLDHRALGLLLEESHLTIGRLVGLGSALSVSAILGVLAIEAGRYAGAC